MLLLLRKKVPVSTIFEMLTILFNSLQILFRSLCPLNGPLSVAKLGWIAKIVNKPHQSGTQEAVQQARHD